LADILAKSLVVSKAPEQGDHNIVEDLCEQMATCEAPYFDGSKSVMRGKQSRLCEPGVRITLWFSLRAAFDTCFLVTFLRQKSNNQK